MIPAMAVTQATVLCNEKPTLLECGSSRTACPCAASPTANTLPANDGEGSAETASEIMILQIRSKGEARALLYLRLMKFCITLNDDK